ncbi:MAG: response regulator [Spirochaetia bacterium]|nr:response regulator [Spirochaetia bacterium]
MEKTSDHFAAQSKQSLILIVDDQPANQILMQKYMEMMGYKSIVAGTGLEAVEMVKPNRPDLIIMDVMMPKMNGFEATKIIKDDPETSGIPVIIMTSLDSEEDRVQGIESGADDFITKPFNEATLRARVKSLLRIGSYNRTIQNQFLRLQKELEMARILQRSILPDKNVTFPELKISHSYIPCSELGGDFYSILPVHNNNHIGFFIADVLGHGVQASLVTMILKTLFDSYKDSVIDPAETLTNINSDLFSMLNNSVTFATACYLVVNTENHTICYSTAGHPPGFLIRRDSNEIIHLKTRGSVIGAFEKMNLESQEIEIFPGDTVFLYTDGLGENFNNKEDEFGLEILPEILQKNSSKSPQEIIAEVMKSLKDFSKTDFFDDDINIICFQYSPETF